VTSPRPVVSPRIALAALAACGILAGWTLRRALDVEPPAGVQPARPVALPVPVPGGGTPAARLAAAVDRDPFHPERRRPAVRFRLPGEALPADSAAAAAGATGPFLLIGTAVLSEGGGFAMCQWGSEPAKLVRVGERVGNLTLELVARGRATFVDAAGRRTEVRVPKAGT